MLLGGLWHGAAWHFVGWGALWGCGLALHHLLRPYFARRTRLPVVIAGWAFTQVFVLVAWVLFRADSFATAGVMLRAMAGDGTHISLLASKDMLAIAAVAVGLVALTLLARTGRSLRLRLPEGRWRPALYGAASAAVILVALVAAPTGREAFIYFQF